MKRNDTFQKWDAHDQERSGTTRFPIDPPEKVSSKAWLLGVAWIVSTLMLVFGALLMILILAGEGHRIGL